VEVGRVDMISRKESAVSAEDDSDDEFFCFDHSNAAAIPMFRRKWAHTWMITITLWRPWRSIRLWNRSFSYI